MNALMNLLRVEYRGLRTRAESIILFRLSGNITALRAQPGTMLFLWTAKTYARLNYLQPHLVKFFALTDRLKFTGRLGHSRSMQITLLRQWPL